MPGGLRGVLALDGPSGTGKTTVARKLAEMLGAAYLDTGAMYRVITLAVLRADVDPANGSAVAGLADVSELVVGTDPQQPEVRLGGEDVSGAIRAEPVDKAVSAVSAVPEVRALVVDEQRRIIAEVLASDGGIVVEGRDIGTAVVPDATLKIYLTASSAIRAQRRSAQDSAAGRESTVDDARASVERRDQLDSTRGASPLRVAEDAVEVDTTELKIDQVLVALSELASQRGMLDGSAAGATP